MAGEKDPKAATAALASAAAALAELIGTVDGLSPDILVAAQQLREDAAALADQVAALPPDDTVAA